MPKLGVNIDHVATLRQARKEMEPDPILAALIAEEAGAESIVAHLREDRRHIQDKDIIELRRRVRGRFNLEMSLNPGIVKMALKIKPDQATLVPERRQEVTTEGGLDVAGQLSKVRRVTEQLKSKGIDVSLFIDPDARQIDATKKIGAPMIELHTGTYARTFSKGKGKSEFKKIQAMTAYAQSIGLIVHAGHGLNYENTAAIARISGMQELNIGHSIISRAVFIGLKNAVKEMVALIK